MIASGILVEGHQVQFHPMGSAFGPPPGPPNFPPGLKRLYEIYRDYIKHEDDLINHRSTWHLLIQGFLFATLGVLGQWQFPKDAPDRWYIGRHGLVLVLAGMGFLIAFFAEISIVAANTAALGIRNQWETVRGQYGDSWKLLPDLAGMAPFAPKQKLHTNAANR